MQPLIIYQLGRMVKVHQQSTSLLHFKQSQNKKITCCVRAAPPLAQTQGVAPPGRGGLGVGEAGWRA